MNDNSPHPWLTPALRQGALMSVGLATVITLNMAGGHLMDTEQALSSRLGALGHVWVGQVLVSAVMLAMIARRYPHVPARGETRRRALAGVVFWTSLAGVFTQFLVALPRMADWSHGVRDFGFGWLWSLSLSTLLVLGHDFAQRSRAAAHVLHDTDLRRMSLARELDAARLQVLQAQVEPHFLFNALANVRRLLRTEPMQARTLIGDLLRYLEEALPAMRDTHSTLGREADLVRAFLAVHQVRMGSRLQADIRIPPELSSRTVPPMVLLTLVENALKHGLQPLVDGGSIEVSARSAAGLLVLTVADTGRGMGSGSGGGTGLANLRARLRSLHGSEASLSLAVNQPRGVIATVELPDPGPGAGA